MLHPTVFNTAQVCHQLGVRHAVLSPGSRNAPLTISFARHQGIKKWIIPDERSAGFVALGIAQETKSPVVLCCTSGTALLNYAPAIAEAYYREIPLIVLSADRPPELIDQRDGQTIRQFDALKNHVKKSIQLPVIRETRDSESYTELLAEGLGLSTIIPYGPVHVNIPFAEPFYPKEGEDLSFQKQELIVTENQTSDESIVIDISSYSKILILIGQHPHDRQLNDVIKSASEYIPVLKFPLNNLNKGIRYADLFMGQQTELKPDLLITTGLSVLSKKLKQFLRANKPSHHLHFDPAGIEIDTFQTQPEIIKGSLLRFLNTQDFSKINHSYKGLWESFDEKTTRELAVFVESADFSECIAAERIFQTLPTNTSLHLSNSMPVRYADMFGIPDGIECFSNRGTSGIDGCTSTALGTALVSDKLNVLLTGDLAFLYDRNAFFNNYVAPNFRIIVLNNQGGGIFRLIEGPSNLPELEDYFETRHNRTAEYICAEYGFEYLKAKDLTSLEENLSTFYEPSQNSKILEVFTDPETNQKVYKKLKNHINERIKN